MSKNNAISESRLAELLAIARSRSANAEGKARVTTMPQVAIQQSTAQTSAPQGAGASGGFTWNTEQQRAIALVTAGKSCAIVGSAGTGKTTLNKTAIRLRMQAPDMPLLETSTKNLIAKNPSLVVLSYTNTAVDNIRNIIGKETGATCLTIHKLLEFAPVWENTGKFNPETGAPILKRTFQPTYYDMNKLPHIATIIIEESGIVNVRLFEQLLAALPHPLATQFIFLGDLFQLPPPYEPSILGYVLNKLEVVELTQVYRQALDSPILKLALDIKERKELSKLDMARLCCEKLTVKPWSAKNDRILGVRKAANLIFNEFKEGRYIPARDMIITPYGAGLNSRDKDVLFGSHNLGKAIADFLGRARGAVVHEIVTSFNKHYLAIGDVVFVGKRKALITAINPNALYLGVPAKPASIHLDRYGHNPKAREEAGLVPRMSNEDIDHLLMATSSGREENGEAKRQASHFVHCKFINAKGEFITLSNDELAEDGEEISENENHEGVTLCTVGDFSLQSFDFGYAQTCYKAQGQEWHNVYIFTHHSQSTHISNEFFYTAITRAKETLTIICEGDHLQIAAKNQTIKGNCWREKARFFTARMDKLSPFPLISQWLEEIKTQNKGAQP